MLSSPGLCRKKKEKNLAWDLGHIVVAIAKTFRDSRVVIVNFELLPADLSEGPLWVLQSPPPLCRMLIELAKAVMVKQTNVKRRGQARMCKEHRTIQVLPINSARD